MGNKKERKRRKRRERGEKGEKEAKKERKEIYVYNIISHDNRNIMLDFTTAIYRK